MTPSAIPITGLARRLVADRLLTEGAAQEAVETARQGGVSFVSYLVQNDLAKARDIAESVADEFGTPLLDISRLDPATIPRHLVDEKLLRAHQVMPIFHRGYRLFVALSDPTQRTGLDAIKFQTSMATEEVLVEEDKLSTFIASFLEYQEEGYEQGYRKHPKPGYKQSPQRGYEKSPQRGYEKSPQRGYEKSAETDSPQDAILDLEAVTSDDLEEEEDVSIADTRPVVRFVNQMLLEAIEKDASDLHFEPFEKSYRIRFRTDGILRQVASPPANLGPRIAARLKVMSRMNVSEKRIPQDGRIKLKLSSSRSIDFRVNTLPVLYGEKICLRILDPRAARMSIDSLGYEAAQKQLYLEALHKPQGMFLVTGPTGSGKTVSLYTGLNILNTTALNISTVEDPIELNLDGINQCPVNYKTGLGFSEALRSFLRQDPDIIMLGEIRDIETANIAIKAAQTGHMVMSTLHTNNAPETITRLRSMGVPAFNLATSINLIVAQRLVRRLCDCKLKLDIPKTALLEKGFSAQDLEAGFDIFGPGGCAKCTDGYRGRVGIFEVMKITPPLSETIMAGGNALQIAAVGAIDGYKNLFQSALSKVQQGVISLEEVDRVTASH